MKARKIKKHGETWELPVNQGSPMAGLSRRQRYWANKRRVPITVEPKLGRNEPCHCGSEKKYKKCCLTKGDSK